MIVRSDFTYCRGRKKKSLKNPIIRCFFLKNHEHPNVNKGGKFIPHNDFVYQRKDDGETESD